MTARHEELKTPEAVLAAHAAGRPIEFKPGRPRSRWVPARCTAPGDEDVLAADFATGGRYRAPIEEPADFPECSGDPASCPENEGYGCCKPNPVAIPAGYTPWSGGECPVSGDTKVTPIFRDGTSSKPNHADNLQWDHYDEETDLIAYRVDQAQASQQGDAVLGWVKQSEIDAVRRNRDGGAVGVFLNADRSDVYQVPLYTHPHPTPAEPLGRDAEGVEGLELTDELRWILGQPNFACIHTANALRRLGHQIKPKSEDEQAAVIHWCLCLYLKHGDSWRDEGVKILEASRAALTEADSNG
jgi:hypothetical protein